MTLFSSISLALLNKKAQHHLSEFQNSSFSNGIFSYNWFTMTLFSSISVAMLKTRSQT